MKLSSIKYYKFLLVLGFLFLMLSKALAGTWYSTFLSGMLIALVLLSFYNSKKLAINFNIITLIFIFYLFLFFISLIRQFFNTNLSFLGFVNIVLYFLSIIFLIFTSIYKIKPTIEEILKLLFKILNVYIVLNVFVFFLGFQKDRYAGVNSLLGLINIQMDRIRFLFSPSLAYFAMICGTSLLVSILLFQKTKKRHYIFMALVSIYALILTDSRGPIFGVLIIFSFLFLIRRFWIKHQIFFFTFYIFSVSLFVSLMLLINKYVFDLKTLSRGGHTTLLSSRDIIWQEFFQNYNPSWFNLLFGYGNVGQLISGISSHYEHLFVNWPNPREISLHNNILQMLVDIGIIGIISIHLVLFFVVKCCIIEYKKSKDVIFLCIPAVINYLLILGFSDIITNISNVGIYFILLFIIAGVLYYNNNKRVNI